MAESRRYPLGAQLDIEQILTEAQHRWLRPAEICEILRNYKKFNIAPEPPHMPPSGSLFLFDRKVLRYFRKDGHNWRKKKDGKTVKEAHERLKAGSIDVLHCYYAHGEENESFQRRSYWLLEEEQSNIVLVHYREVKGNRANFNRVKDVEEAIPNSQESEEVVPYSEVDSSISSKFNPYNYQLTSQNTDTTSLNSTQASEYEDAESAYNHQASSGFHSFLENQPRVMEKMDNGLPVPYYPVRYSNDYQEKLAGIPGVDFVPFSQGNKDKNGGSAALTYDPQNIQSWKDILESSSAGTQSVQYQASFSSNHSDRMSFGLAQGNELLGQILTDGIDKKQDLGIYPQLQDQWQNSEGGYPYLSKWPMDQKLHPDLPYHLTTGINGEGTNPVDLLNAGGPSNSQPAEQTKYNAQKDPRIQLAHPAVSDLKSEESNLTAERKADNPPLIQPLLDGLLREGLKKLDSFDRWMSKELGDVNESHIQSSSGTYWEAVETEDGGDDCSIAPQLDTYVLGPSLSQDQLFSIIDFSPNWAYAGSEIKVLITGKFLKSQKEVEECQWSCMFGEVEVPAEVIADGVLRCHTPLHNAGRIPFYVTCSNRLACSEVREFEYRVDNIQDVDVPDIYTNEIILRMRFGKLLSLESANGPRSVPSTPGEESDLSRKISSLLKEDNEWEDMLKLTSEDIFSVEKVKEQLLEKLLKEKLHVWLLQKIAEGGKGPNVLDEEGQGVLHFAAALGYHWAIPPTVAAGVNVNFRDVNGWTALHWAAFCGRERTVGFLISQGAAAGALTDPTPHLSGQTPADLASSKGHKGIAGFLAESALSSHLCSLELKDGSEVGAGESSGLKAVLTVSERTATPVSDGDSMKDSLAAVCNAIQAADRIHQVFRVQSFQRKQIKEYGDEKFGLSEERALSLVALKTSRFGQHEVPAHAAAIRIQNKFRSWKGRKEFLTIREQIVKIQAHVRGHQVRKNYKKIIWSVGILEKIILRWRRKGSGLRGFKKEALTQGSSIVGTSAKEDDYDFLKEGRKQTEERLQKALARVKSMVQYPEARDQYRRLLNVVTDMQEAKAVDERVLDNTEETAYFDEDLIDIDALLDDDTFMPAAT